MSIAVQCQSSARGRLVARDPWAQQCLAEGFRRLRMVYAGRLTDALPGISHQYISAVLRGEAPCSLARFVSFLGPLSLTDREFVLEAWTEDALEALKAPLVEVAEATEATGEALGLAQRLLAAPTVSPRQQEEVHAAVRMAQRELEDVAHAAGGDR